MSGVTCRVCDLENAEGARFCSACGAALVQEKTGDALIGRTLAGKFRIESLLGMGPWGACTERRTWRSIGAWR